MSVQEYFLPKTIEEALRLLDHPGEDVLLLAGGTLAMPLINEGISTPNQVVGLKDSGLNYLKRENHEFVFGATTTLTTMESQQELSILRDAARAVGGWAIRNMGTVGGNLFAPPPGGDFAVALLALDSRIVITSGNGVERTVPIDEFFTGFMMNVLQPGEIVKEFRIPLPVYETSYLKFGRRAANTPSVVTVAVNLNFSGENVETARIALGAVGPHPIRVYEAEAALIGKPLSDANIQTAAEMAVGECEPFTDPVASEWYRKKMIPIIIRRCIEIIKR